MKKVLVLLVFLTGCSFYKPVAEHSLPLVIPKPIPLNLQEVLWSITIQENQPLYCMNGTSYKHLAENMEAIKQHMTLQKQIIGEYESYYNK